MYLSWQLQQYQTFSVNLQTSHYLPLSQAEMSCHSPLRRAPGAMLSRLLTNSVDIVLSSFLYEPRGHCVEPLTNRVAISPRAGV